MYISSYTLPCKIGLKPSNNAQMYQPEIAINATGSMHRDICILIPRSPYFRSRGKLSIIMQ
jgi:hypothetical protein